MGDGAERKTSGWGRRSVRALLALAWLLTGAEHLAGQDPRSEYQMKAVYLKTIPSFVEWPGAGRGSVGAQPLHICVTGNNSFGLALGQETAISTANGRKM